MSSSVTGGGPQSGPGSPPGGAWMGSGRRGGAGLRLGLRRSVPHLLVGVLLVVVCVSGLVWWSLRVGARVAVLALARPVVAGQVLGAGDLREVRIGTDPGVAVLPAGQAWSVVGRTMASTLPAGSLLSAGVLATGTVPGPGEAITALALKPGAFPPEVGPGDRVAVVAVPAAALGSPTADNPPGSGMWVGTVISVRPPADATQTAGVSVRLSQDAARQVAALGPGQVSVVLLPGGGR